MHYLWPIGRLSTARRVLSTVGRVLLSWACLVCALSVADRSSKHGSARAVDGGEGAAFLGLFGLCIICGRSVVLARLGACCRRRGGGAAFLGLFGLYIICGRSVVLARLGACCRRWEGCCFLVFFLFVYYLWSIMAMPCNKTVHLTDVLWCTM